MTRKLFPIICLSAVLLSSAAALAGSDIYVGGPYGTKIASLPYTISAPGAYYLGGNLTYSGSGPADGISIKSDDVTIDLMGFSLTYTGSFTATTYAVQLYGRKNVEIRNGTLSGWDVGIYVSGPGVAHRVINVRFEDNTKGMLLNGSGHLVQGCQATAGSSAVYGFYVGQGTVTGCQVKNLAGDAIMIGSVTTGSIISGNVVTSAPGGIGLIASGPSLIMGNEVTNCATGIWSNGGSLVGNTVNTASSSQIGIAVPHSASFPTLMDQNTVTGPGTHYDQGSGVVQMRNNAGYP
jgi:hypothetical protein